MSLSRPGTGNEDEITYEISRYDAFGRLVSVQNDNYVAGYGYNADGLRVSKDISKSGEASSTRFLYEGGYVTLELDGDQAAYNVYGGESIISRTTPDGTAYYIYNGRGDVVQLTNAGGLVTVEYDYDAFGNLLMEYMDDLNPFRYCGEYWDKETRNYYLRARYYSPSTGRFTQRDAFLGFYGDPLSLNRYTYAHNNPVKYRDPTGYSAESNIQSAYNAWQGGYITYAQYAANVWLNGGTPSANPNGSGINFGPNEGADWLRTGSGKTFEEYWGVGPYGVPLPATQTPNPLLPKDPDKSGAGSPVKDSTLVIEQTSNPTGRSNSIRQSNYGDSSMNISTMKYLLYELGYYENYLYRANNDFDSFTVSALMRFQLYHMGQSWNDLFDQQNGRYYGCGPNTSAALSQIFDLYSSAAAGGVSSRDIFSNLRSTYGYAGPNPERVTYPDRFFRIVGNAVYDSEIFDRPRVHAKAATNSDRLSAEQQRENVEYIYRYLSNLGWTKEAICGLLGNIQQESWFNPGVWQYLNNVGFGYGIIQWTAASEKFLFHYGYSIKDVNWLASSDAKRLMDEQLEYLVYSSLASTPYDRREWFDPDNHYTPYLMTYSDYIASTHEAVDLAWVFHAHYVRSGDSREYIEETRVAFARNWVLHFEHW